MKLRLLPVTATALDAELGDNMEQLGSTLGAEVGEWPPEGGEWDRAAVEFFRRQIDTGSMDKWGPMYVICARHLVGSAGFFGPPDEEDEVEIGYSVCRVDRGRGVATAVIAELCALAATGGAGSIRARTTPDNLGSIVVLERNQFVESASSTAASGVVELVFRRSLG